MNKLLKDAIADAKAVRETALANAKIALEEAFQPRLERMFSEKMKSEMMDGEPEEESEGMIPAEDEVRPVGEGESQDGMARMKELAGLNEFGDDDFGGGDYGDDDEDDFNMDFEEEPGAAKAAQADMKGEFSDDEEEDAGYGDDEDDFGDDEDLEEIIRQLEEEEMNDGMEDSMPKEAMKKKYMEEDLDLSEELDEELDLEEVIAALREDDDTDNDDMEKDDSVNEMLDQPADFMQMLPGIMAIVGSAGAAIGARELINNKLAKLAKSEDPKVADRAKKTIAFFNGMANSMKEGEAMNTMEDENTMQELEEAYSVIEHLREKINEVNLLNAKLLYVNKVFKKHSLSESQKLRVVESFDRATTVRETKLIYTTLSESLATKPATKNKVMEGFASSPVKKTQILTESNTIVSRFQKLAGINNQD